MSEIYVILITTILGLCGAIYVYILKPKHSLQNSIDVLSESIKSFEKTFKDFNKRITRHG